MAEVRTMGEKSYFEGHILLRESVGQMTLDSARALMVDQGFIVEQEKDNSDGKASVVYAAGPLLEFREAFDELVETLKLYIDVEAAPGAADGTHEEGLTSTAEMAAQHVSAENLR